MDLSPLQVLLLDFINMYEQIDEMDPKDRPDDEIIEDDIALDEYMEELIRKKKYEAIHGSSKSADSHEHIVRFDHGMGEPDEQ